MLKKYDIIGFDPRGVGRSTPAITCYTDPKKEDKLLYGTYDEPVRHAGLDRRAHRASRRTGRRPACKNTGPLLGHIDAESIARDMDVIRAVLGDDEDATTSATRTAPTSARCTPSCSRRRSAAWCSTVPIDPLVGQLDALATQMAGFDSALQAYMADCQSQKGLPVHRSVDDGLQQVRAILDGIDARHLVGDPTDGPSTRPPSAPASRTTCTPRAAGPT